MLKQIYDSPRQLYINGSVELLNTKCIAIIGSREPTEYGKKIANYLSYNLAKQGYTIVSGLAKGVDTCAHIGALKANGKTIAVVGNGLNITYPKENKMLEQYIIRNNNAIISEYDFGTKPEKKNFPARNRIISGLSKGVIIVEAKERSGTLITVDFALEQGREVFVVPRKYRFIKFSRNK